MTMGQKKKKKLKNRMLKAETNQKIQPSKNPIKKKRNRRLLISPPDSHQDAQSVDNKNVLALEGPWNVEGGDEEND